MFARKIILLLLVNIFDCFWCQNNAINKGIFIKFQACVFKLQIFKKLRDFFFFFGNFWATSPLTSMGNFLLQNFAKLKTFVFQKCKVETSPNDLCLLLDLFNFAMIAKSLKYVDQKRQDTFYCKSENTLKSMEFSKVTNNYVY